LPPEFEEREGPGQPEGDLRRSEIQFGGPKKEVPPIPQGKQLILHLFHLHQLNYRKITKRKSQLSTLLIAEI
jgi:hypothetical protein